MDESLERIYLSQVKQEWDLCQRAIRDFNGALDDSEKNDPFPYAIQFVNHCAAISRMFWPPKNSRKDAHIRAQVRGNYLRNALSIKDDHPVKGRQLRDHFEHFDERLDEWAERSRYRNIVNRLLGPRQLVGGDGVEDGDVIHHYDPETKIYAFRGQKFDMQELAAGVADIYMKLEVRLAVLNRR